MNHTASVVRATPEVNDRRKNYPCHHTTSMNRQSPNIAHVITSIICASMPHLVQIAEAYHFLIYLYTEICTRTYSLRRWTDFDMRRNKKRIHAWQCLLQLEHTIVTFSPSNPRKPIFWGTYNRKHMANIYSHNCMVLRDTSWNVAGCLNLPSILSTGQSFSIRCTAGASSSHIIFWDPIFICETNRSWEVGILLGIYNYLDSVKFVC